MKTEILDTWYESYNKSLTKNWWEETTTKKQPVFYYTIEGFKLLNDATKKAFRSAYRSVPVTVNGETSVFAFYAK